MKVLVIDISPWSLNITVELDNVGNMVLKNVLSDQDIVDIKNIALRAAQRHLEPSKVLAALKSEPLVLIHEGKDDGEAQDGDFTPVHEDVGVSF